jgi:predicted protein tyrosine phosphatase
MEKIRIFSRKAVEGFSPPKVAHAWISIISSGEEAIYIPLRKPYDAGIKLVQFDNVSSSNTSCIAPDTQHAREIYHFVKWVHRGIGELYIYCDTGLSKSAGVAAAISRIYFNTNGEFAKAPYTPNKLIYNLILDVYSGNSVKV